MLTRREFLHRLTACAAMLGFGKVAAASSGFVQIAELEPVARTGTFDGHALLPQLTGPGWDWVLAEAEERRQASDYFASLGIKVRPSAAREKAMAEFAARMAWVRT